MRYKKLFVRRGILLATSNNGDIDLSTPSGVLTATIKTAVSEHEISMMKIRMRRAAKQKAERGSRSGSGRSGTSATPTSPTRTPHRWSSRLTRAVLAGGSITDGARMFNAAGRIRADRQAVDRRRRVSLFLRKPRNAGLRAHNGDETARSKAPGRRWWTNRLGGQRNPCSTRRAAHPAARVCAGTC